MSSFASTSSVSKTSDMARVRLNIGNHLSCRTVLQAVLFDHPSSSINMVAYIDMLASLVMSAKPWNTKLISFKIHGHFL